MMKNSSDNALCWFDGHVCEHYPDKYKCGDFCQVWNDNHSKRDQ